MGPPPFGGGNRLREKLSSPGVGRLQWGHRLSAVETLPGGEGKTLAIGASMGPPPFGGGNIAAGHQARNEHRSFNGATAFRRWKLNTCRGGFLSHPGELQWGHRLSAVETLYNRWVAEAEGNVLQWGHRLSAVETRPWAA